MEIPLKTLVKTSVAKQELLNKLNQARPDLGLPSDPNLIQLREKSGDDKLTQVYHDARELSRYHMYDGKEIAI